MDKGGEEVAATCLDLGTQSVKLGWAGEDTPKFVFPSQAGIIPGSAESMSEDHSRRSLRVGANALFCPQDYMEVGSPFRDGIYDDWEIIESIFDYSFRDRLRCDPKEYPAMITEPSFHPKAAREKVVELLFEKFGVPAMFLAKSHALTCFSVARQTGLVIDSGYETTSMAAVHDGYVLQKSIVKSPLAGKALTGALRASLETERVRFRPRYEFTRAQVDGKWVIKDKPHGPVPPSYREYAVEQIVQDIKEGLCRVNDTPMDFNDSLPGVGAPGLPSQTYELPDGQEVEVGEDRLRVPECLFNPEVLTRYRGFESYRMPDGGPLQSLPRLSAQCVNLCDVDLRKELYQGVVLTGGTSMFNGLRDRMEKEMQELAPTMVGAGIKVKVISPTNAVERKYSAWIGGSILASLGAFQQMWMSKKEYDENGAGFINRKSS